MCSLHLLYVNHINKTIYMLWKNKKVNRRKKMQKEKSKFRSEVDEHRTCYTEWSKSEKEKQTLYINAYIWNLEK